MCVSWSVTSIYFRGIGNDSAFGTWSRTRGSHDDFKWSSSIDQKSLRASASSWVSAGWDSHGSPWSSSQRSSLPAGSYCLRVRSRISWYSKRFCRAVCDWEHENVHTFCGVNTSFASMLRGWISDASIFSKSSMSSTRMSPFQIPPAYRSYPRNNPGKTVFPNWWILDWSFAVLGWYSTNEPNGIIGPLNGSPKRLS